MCVIYMQNFMQISQTVAQIWPFLTFQDGGRQPYWIFEIENFNDSYR